MPDEKFYLRTGEHGTVELTGPDKAEVYLDHPVDPTYCTAEDVWVEPSAQ